MNDLCFLDISFGYDEKSIVKSLYLRIPSGKTTMLCGKSGLGKTSLLSLIMGFIKPISGKIINLPKKISAVFQEDRLIEHFNAMENVIFACPCADKNKIKADFLYLNFSEDDLTKKASELSGGMRRRVALIRALNYDADILLLDESFKGLDHLTKLSAIELVNACPIKTKIIVSHEKSEWDAFNLTPYSLEKASLPLKIQGEMIEKSGKHLCFLLNKSAEYLPQITYKASLNDVKSLSGTAKIYEENESFFADFSLDFRDNSDRFVEKEASILLEEAIKNPV